MNKLITEITATLLLLLLFSITIIVSINNSVIFGQNESMAEQMSAGQNEVGGIPISSLTEWIGIFSIGIFVGILAFNTNTLDSICFVE